MCHMLPGNQVMFKIISNFQSERPKAVRKLLKEKKINKRPKSDDSSEETNTSSKQLIVSITKNIIICNKTANLNNTVNQLFASFACFFVKYTDHINT